MHTQNTHPGHFIRDRIIPKGMSVTDAAKLLDVGRPALSNLLNGNAALSPDMAARIERAFGTNARELIDMQASYDAALAKERGAASSARAYIPPFMQFRASDLEDWAGKIAARSRLSVFLRTLVNSTGVQISNCSFPGNDDSERPGWDGYVEAGEATPWIPVGKSGWEFGVNVDPKEKADGDYAKSVAQHPAAERAEITFVFVTPRRWRGKDAWEKAHRAAGDWKDVRVFDASNLEEWLEQSIAGQAWFASEIGAPTQGVLSLDACWDAWTTDTLPTLSLALFADNLETARQTISSRFGKSGEPVLLTADSKEEALGFLSALFAGEEHELVMYRDRVAVFTEPGPLSKLASKAANFIPVITSKAVEKEFAPFKRDMRSILIYPRNAAQVEPDIVLEPLGYNTFEAALTEMGFGRDDIDRLARESGRSLTVLRRRLSSSEAIRTPAWASNPFASDLVPLMLAGAWDAKNSADQSVLGFLARGTPYDPLERSVATLVHLEDAPLWSVGSFRGVVSKIDVLFAVAPTVTAADLETFFQVAELVLSEDDPSLDVPEDRRWFTDKRREISPTLRDSICETLVLLAVHGKPLFLNRLGIDCEVKARLLVRSLLNPVSARRLEADSHDLPMYAEACPEEFLDLIEADLRSPDPECLKLMRPARAGVFGHCPRTGLLWALENTAWAPGMLVRTAAILARLASVPIEDNWANKPAASLAAIFRCWMPQTTASVTQRISALKYLVEHHPEVAWSICVGQAHSLHQLGHYSHKPRWRPDARGAGEPVTRGEVREFAAAALGLALGWKTHNRKTLGDLTANLQWLDNADQEKVWGLIQEWARGATDEDKAWLREKLRLHTMTRKAKANTGNAIRDAARKVREQLKPNDIILEHSWLFKTHWVDESADEIADEELDYQKREQRLIAMREQALKEVMQERGVKGAIKLAESGEAASVVGWLMQRLTPLVAEAADTIRTLLIESPSSPTICQSIVAGFLRGMPDEKLPLVLEAACRGLTTDQAATILTLAPFREKSWNVAASMGAGCEDLYWRTVRPSWGAWEEELPRAVERLINAARPRAAFSSAEFHLERLPLELLFRLISAIPASQEADGYQLDPFRIAEALKLLTKSSAFSVEELATLEFLYLDALDRHQGEIPNLESQLERHPELFVQAVAFIYKRQDDGLDPELLRTSNDNEKANRAHLGYRLLDMMTRIPGHDAKGNLNSQILIAWIQAARKGCADLARAEVGDSHIGQLLAKAPVGSDGIWPIEAVRDAIESTYSDSLASGVHMGLFNSRGAHSRALDEGGAQERELAARYHGWARALEFTHPQVAKILSSMVRTYEHDAEWQDTEEEVRRRLMR